MFIFILFIYYLLTYNLNPDTAGSARIKAKETRRKEKREEKERDRGTESETLYRQLMR